MSQFEITALVACAFDPTRPNKRYLQRKSRALYRRKLCPIRTDGHQDSHLLVAQAFYPYAHGKSEWFAESGQRFFQTVSLTTSKTVLSRLSATEKGTHVFVDSSEN